jgi:hypothetical protein
LGSRVLALDPSDFGQKAKAALANAVDQHAAGAVELQNLNLAIEQAKARDIEERHASSEAATVSMARVAQSIGRALFDNRKKGRYPSLRNGLAQPAGAAIDGYDNGGEGSSDRIG